MTLAARRRSPAGLMQGYQGEDGKLSRRGRRALP